MRHSMMIVCAVLSVSGCAENRQYFRPTEHVYGETMAGEREAIYSLVGPAGPFGEAKIWSRGAFREDRSTVVHVTLDVHNTSGAPIVVRPSQLRLDPVRAGTQLLHDFAPLEMQALSIAPGAFGRVQLHFVLPNRIRPGEISSFGLRWLVENGPHSYAQLTPFVEERGSFAAYPPIYGYGYGYPCTPYDPFCARGFYGYGGYGVHGGFAPANNSGGRSRMTVHTR